ncbi:MAG TPA: DUF4440 domain-containing protein [Thermoanaerobaculia bacterium]|nr:DUF4440 domain-containing protein [Thermoanaerobaculia bacterium]
MSERELWDLERQFWTGGAPIYEERLAPESLMVFPQPAGVLDRAATIAAIQQAPRWEDVRFSSQRIAFPGPQVAVLVYEATADRSAPDTEYAAQCSSTYVKLGGSWKLALHQQTPAARRA